MGLAKSGSTVKVHYTGKFIDGFVFDSSIGGEPLEFVLGSGQVIAGFDAGVIGMAIGDTKTVEIPAAEAYGEYTEENKITIPKEEIPADLQIEVGSVLNMHQDGTGQVMQVTVAEVTQTTVTLDGNHPMAGKTLVFDLELVAIG